MTYESLMALLGNWLLPGSLVAIMVSMGLSLTADDFRQVFRNRRALIFGVCSMLIIPPLIGIGLAVTVAPMRASGSATRPPPQPMSSAVNVASGFKVFASRWKCNWAASRMN